MRSLMASAGPPVLAAAGVVMLTVALVSQASAQMPGVLQPDPDMPVKDGFDTGRAIFWERPNFTPLRDPEWESLRAARRAGRIADDTPVLTFVAGGETLVLVSSQMSYHHVAQGDIEGEPWMVTF